MLIQEPTDQSFNNLAEGGQYNELNHLLENNSFTIQYDLNGNQTKKLNKATGEFIEYFWTVENKLHQVKIFKNASTLKKTVNYRYDGLDRRISREVIDHQNSSKSYTQKFVYDGDHILAILDQNDQFVAGFLHGDGVDEPLMMVTDYDQDGRLDALTFVKDHLNSVRLLVNEKGEVLQSIGYSAYGETFIHTSGQKNIKINNPFYYTSRELETETGDYYYRARYYNPNTGRFLSEDPIGFEGGDQNIFRYTNNNPLIFRDPSGTTVLEDIIKSGICKATNGRCCQGSLKERITCSAEEPKPKEPSPEDPPKNQCRK